MPKSISPWWLFPHRRSHTAQDPGEILFRGLRLRLTLWYCCVVSIALVLFGATVYVGTSYFLLSPIANDASMNAHVRAYQWHTISVKMACAQFADPSHPFAPGPGKVIACFDQHGLLLPNNSTKSLPAEFLSNTIAKTALRTGQPASDRVDAGGLIGQIYRYALAVPDSTGHRYLGVVLIGETIKAQEDQLSLLLALLLAVGGITLLGGGAGGLFLANRALAPARLAWSNQQRFIADASHELRTPLTLLRADAEVLLRNRAHLKEEDAALLEDIVTEANHMARLYSNMLMLARLDARSTRQEHEVIQLANVAAAAVRRVQALADQKKISVHSESYGKAVVIGDPTLLEEAILALLDNAIKYTNRGGRVTVCTAVNNAYALLEVVDTGIGIPPEHLPNLGKRFYRVDKARSRQVGGTGLGLSIVQSIANAHGGRVTLTSVPEQGTRVMLTLPQAHATQPLHDLNTIAQESSPA
jgi:signal transduction histidine kinase